RAQVLLGESLEKLGEYDRARTVVQPVLDALPKAERLSDIDGILNGVRALRLRAKLDGTPAAGYTRMIGLLSKIHQEIDRLHWPALLLEAELLIEKGSRDDGLQVLEQV